MTIQNLPDYLATLQAYIGAHIEHQGQRCQLIEILHTDQTLLVFRCDSNDTPQIQSNQHGNANRRVANTYTINLLNDSGNDLHPVAKECLPTDIHQSLLDKLLKA